MSGRIRHKLTSLVEPRQILWISTRFFCRTFFLPFFSRPNCQGVSSANQGRPQYRKHSTQRCCEPDETFSQHLPILASQFKIGDLVLLWATHIHTTRPSERFDNLNVGPFHITHGLGLHNFRLNMGHRQIHSVFHIDRLIAYTLSDSLTSHPCSSHPPPRTTDPVKYAVEEIVDSLTSPTTSLLCLMKTYSG